MDDVRRRYLENQVQQASPQRLWLLLLAGAANFTRRALSHWEAGEPAEGFDTLLRAKEIAAEMYQSLRRDGWPGAEEMVRVYRFLYAEYTALHLDELRARAGELEVAPDFRRRRLEALLSLLEVELETWALVCDEHPDMLPADAQRRLEAHREVTWDGRAEVSAESLREPSAGPQRPKMLLEGITPPVGTALNLDA